MHFIFDIFSVFNDTFGYKFQSQSQCIFLVHFVLQICICNQNKMEHFFLKQSFDSVCPLISIVWCTCTATCVFDQVNYVKYCDISQYYDIVILSYRDTCIVIRILSWGPCQYTPLLNMVTFGSTMVTMSNFRFQNSCPQTSGRCGGSVTVISACGVYVDDAARLLVDTKQWAFWSSEMMTLAKVTVGKSPITESVQSQGLHLTEKTFLFCCLYSLKKHNMNRMDFWACWSCVNFPDISLNTFHFGAPSEKLPSAAAGDLICCFFF